jgi:hypothetical protein
MATTLPLSIPGPVGANVAGPPLATGGTVVAARGTDGVGGDVVTGAAALGVLVVVGTLGVPEAATAGAVVDVVDELAATVDVGSGGWLPVSAAPATWAVGDVWAGLAHAGSTTAATQTSACAARRISWRR